ncbi:MAG: hypothetical protein AAFN11_04675 [Chloroflexota bacterium]
MTEHPKPKKKGGSLGQWQFLLLWIAGHFGAFFGAVAISLLLPTTFISTFVGAILQVLIIGGGTLWAQKILLQRYTGRKVDGWLKSGVFGWVLGLLLSFVLALGLIAPAEGNIASLPAWALMLTYLPALALPSITHAARLRKYVDNAWLYVLGSVVAALLLPMFISINNTSLLSYVGGLTTYALTTGLTLIWLFGMSGGASLLEDTDSDTLADATTRLSDEDVSQNERRYPPTDADKDSQRGLLDKWLAWLRGLRPTPTA